MRGESKEATELRMNDKDSWHEKARLQVSLAVIAEQPGFAEALITFQEPDIRRDAQFEAARSLVEIWSSWPGKPPFRQSLDPVQLGAKLLPSIVLLEALDGGSDYRWRIFGSLHEREYGADLRGHCLSEVESQNPSADALRRVLDEVRVTVSPVYYRLQYSSAIGLKRRASGVVLPLADDDGAVGWLCGCASWH